MYHSYDKEGLLREQRRSDTRERRKSNLAIPRHLVKRVRENPVKRADLLLSRMFHLPLERVVTDPFPPPPPPPLYHPRYSAWKTFFRRCILILR